ncbi:heavy-metal-associated domain-containing protein [Melioribacteraceae bacterium 4301-Me]|uniref:heavy-metal-associated domain-containing protein n=1 Tax=Pyranulibacter aquaticus TaxID=3163344 RepID=UPI003598408F
MTTKDFKIEGMSCHHCVMAIEKELSKLELESKNVEIGKAKVVYDENKINEQSIINAIEEAGYKVIGSNNG